MRENSKVIRCDLVKKVFVRYPGSALVIIQFSYRDALERSFVAVKDGRAGCALFVGSFVLIFGGELLADSTIFTDTSSSLVATNTITVRLPQKCLLTPKFLRA